MGRIKAGRNWKEQLYIDAGYQSFISINSKTDGKSNSDEKNCNRNRS